tara:strand:+ start:8176 stop:8736 length:561 start_codon:yes stop_codon:yes gene_type:complete
MKLMNVASSTRTERARKMKRSVAGLILMVLVACSSAGPVDPNRHVSENGSCSFVVPDGWRLEKVPGIDVEFLLYEAQDGFTPNINFVEEPYPGSLRSYVEANLTGMTEGIPKFAIVEQKPFTLNSGAEAQKVVSRSVQQGAALEQHSFLVDAGKRKFVITCSRLQSDARDLTGTFDGLARSFQAED